MIRFKQGKSGLGKIINVADFGAKGNGIKDDTKAIQRAIDKGGRNSVIYFPKGDYFITKQLYPRTNQTWQGEGSLDYADFTYNVNKIEYTGNTREYKVYLKEPNEEILRYIKGDQIFLKGFNNALHNKPHEIKEIIDNKTILIKHTYYDSADYNEDDVNDATARIPFTVGGSAIRHRSLKGDIIEGEWFINSAGLDYFCLRDIGFVGAGVNNSSGSGIKIVRDEAGAMEGFQWINVSWMDIPDNAITIEAPINSRFEMIRAKKCAFDFFNIVSINGSAMTSTVFKNIYVTSARRGLVIDTAVYNLFDSLVFEGVSIGIHGKVMNSNTFNSVSTETVKFRKFRGGQGVSFLFENSYGNVFNSPSVIYNSETYEWVKGSFMFLGDTYADLPTATIIGGRSHNSINTAHNVLTIEQADSDNKNVRIYYVDTTLKTLESEYTKAGRFIAIHKSNYKDIKEIERFRIIDLYEVDKNKIQTDNTHYDKDADPTADDDSDAGYNVGDTWTNSNTSDDWLCIDNTNDNAIWRKTKELSAIVVDARYEDSINMQTTNETKFTKIGRTVGSDLYSVNAYRVWQLSYDKDNTELSLWLDVYDRLPNLYIHKLHLDADNKSYSTEMLCSTMEVVTIDDNVYLEVGFKASRTIKDATDFNWHDSEVQKNTDGSVYTGIKYIECLSEDFTATRYKWDEESKMLYLYFTPTRFLKDTDTISLFGMLNDRLNLKNIPISSVVKWDIIPVDKDPIAIKVKVNIDLANYGIDHDLLEKEEIGIYVMENRLHSNNGGQITLINSPMYRSVDEDNRITRSNIYNGNLVLNENENEKLFKINMPYNFNWTCFNDNVSIEILDNNTLKFVRTDDSTNEIDVVFQGMPKKEMLFIGK